MAHVESVHSAVEQITGTLHEIPPALLGLALRQVIELVEGNAAENGVPSPVLGHLDERIRAEQSNQNARLLDGLPPAPDGDLLDIQAAGIAAWKKEQNLRLR